jgi:VIT1/CCC1 family predicted Fe2+/Mn2+ transporter
MVNQKIKDKILFFQRNEISEYFIYRDLARAASPENQRILEEIAEQELRHSQALRQMSGQATRPDRLKIVFYSFLARFFGLAFGLKLMERGERLAQKNYLTDPEFAFLLKDEEEHERKVLALLSSQKLRYAGSMVLGLNDALVELTGVLAGLTLAFGQTKIIAAAGLITGLAASLAMAASEFLSVKEDGQGQALTAGLITGVSYVLTVGLLILPYFIFSSPLTALAFSLTVAFLIIVVFNFYLAVAKDLSFKKKFLQMLLITSAVALVNFLLGTLIKNFFNL